MKQFFLSFCLFLGLGTLTFGQEIQSLTESSPKFITKQRNEIKFEKEWQVESDFNQAQILVKGGDITNRTNKEVQNLVFNFFVSKQALTEIDENFDGLLVATVNLDTNMAAMTIMESPTFGATLNPYPPSGDYFLILAISSIDEEGNYQICDTRTFDKPISF